MKRQRTARISDYKKRKVRKDGKERQRAEDGKSKKKGNKDKKEVEMPM